MVRRRSSSPVQRMMQLSSGELAAQRWIFRVLTSPKLRVSMPQRIAISHYMTYCREAKERIEARKGERT